MPALGKRTRSAAQATPDKPAASSRPPIKRARTIVVTLEVDDPNANKENIPPYSPTVISTPSVSVHDAEDNDIDMDAERPQRVTRSGRRVSDAPPAQPTNIRIRARRTVSTPIPRVTHTMPQRTTSLALSITPPLTPSSEQSQEVDTPLLTPSLDMGRIQLGEDVCKEDAEAGAVHVPVQTAYALARGALKPSSDTAPLIGRTSERNSILSFLSLFLSSTSSNQNENSLYISGTPGTGKTALVRSVLDELALTGPSIVVGMVNCMGLGTPKEVYEACWRSLMGEGKVKDAENSLKALFAKGRDEGVKYILALDEIDILLRSSSLLTALLHLPHTYPASLRLLAIANSLALPTLLPAAHPPAHLSFAPYTHAQMVDIIRAKLAATPPSKDGAVLDDKALELAARRVGGRTGDLRVLVEVVRKALDGAEKEWRAGIAKDPFAAGELVKVSLPHVMQAIKTVSISHPTTTTAMSTATASSPTTELIRSLPLHARLALLSILLSAQRASLALPALSPSAAKPKFPASPHPSPAALHQTYSALLARYGDAAALPPALGTQEFADVLDLLDSSSLLSISTPSTARKSKEKTVKLVLSAEDVQRGLFAEESLKGVWEKACKDTKSESVRRGNAAAQAEHDCPIDERL